MIRRAIFWLFRRRPRPLRPIAFTTQWTTRVGVLRLAQHIKETSR